MLFGAKFPRGYLYHAVEVEEFGNKVPTGIVKTACSREIDADHVYVTPSGAWEWSRLTRDERCCRCDAALEKNLTKYEKPPDDYKPSAPDPAELAQAWRVVQLRKAREAGL